MSTSKTIDIAASRQFGGMDFLEGDVGRRLLRFAIPILGINVLQSLSASINTAWSGHLLGADALTASVNANGVLLFIQAIAMGPGEAINAFVGQAMGRRDIGEVQRVVWTGLTGLAVLSILLALGATVYVPLLARGLQVAPQAFEQTVSYLTISFLALPIAFLYVCVSMVSRGMGDARTPLLVQAASAASDLILTPVFMLGLGPVPEMGVSGAAFATAITQLAGLLYLGGRIHRKSLPRAAKDLSVSLSSHSHLSPGLFVRMFKKGLPITVQMVVISTSLLFLISLANPYGTLTVAAYGACLQLWAYIQMPAFAIASAVGTMAAHNIGAGLWDRVAQVTRHGIICGLILTISLVALAKLTEHGALQIFLGDNHAAINAASRINDIVSWSFIPFSVTFTLVAVMRSAGQTLVPLLITFLGLWVVRVPLAFFLRPYLEQDAIFWSTPCASMVMLALTMSYYRFGKWRAAHL